MNAYADLTRIKSRLNITGTGDDTDLTMLLNAASRVIEKVTRRHFYLETATKYFDGVKPPLDIEELISITTMKLDFDGNTVFEETMQTTDYILKPMNKFPKTFIEMAYQGSYASFADDIPKGVEIVGGWGYAESSTPYVSSGGTVTVGDGSATSVTASDGTLFAVGQTILAGTEQMYISAISSNTMTCTRAVNGTTGAAQASASASIYNYPEPVVEACLIQAMRWWKRKDTAFQTQVASANMGGISTVAKYERLDPDVVVMLTPYIDRGSLFI